MRMCDFVMGKRDFDKMDVKELYNIIYNQCEDVFTSKDLLELSKKKIDERQIEEAMSILSVLYSECGCKGGWFVKEDDGAYLDVSGGRSDIAKHIIITDSKDAIKNDIDLLLGKIDVLRGEILRIRKRIEIEIENEKSN